MERTRVVLKLPRLLSDILREFLEARANVEIVATLDAFYPLEAAAQQYTPDIVIVSETEFRLPPTWLDLLEAHPGLRFLAISSEGSRGALCEVLGNVPPNELATAILEGGWGSGPPVRNT